ncbi:hypothetical protein CBR_g49071 [Chara braunii]|uniref:Uncharacterized protein n=1 Tax=Chara braunii TaxID=69332 RepID=A0A388M493_CHABU|nr:hypothetical protein CBR_g49071 [Chara braunii]|eukprot:GBG89361.1 hypothetical protein CBR_g49071 [Chara braunii]
MQKVYGAKGNVVSNSKGSLLDLELCKGFGAGAVNTPFYRELVLGAGFVLAREFLDMLEDKNIALVVPCEVDPSLELSLPLKLCSGCESSGAAAEGGDLGSGPTTQLHCGESRARSLLGSEVARKYNFERWPARMVYFSDDNFEVYFLVSSQDNKRDLKAPPRQLKLSMRDIRWQWKRAGCPRAVMGNPSGKQDQVRKWREFCNVALNMTPHNNLWILADQQGEEAIRKQGAALRSYFPLAMAGENVWKQAVEFFREMGEADCLDTMAQSFVQLLESVTKKGEGVVFLEKRHARSIWEVLKAGRHVIAMEGNSELLQFTIDLVKSEVNSGAHNCEFMVVTETQARAWNNKTDMWFKLSERKRNKIYDLFFLQTRPKRDTDTEYVRRKDHMFTLLNNYHGASHMKAKTFLERLQSLYFVESEEELTFDSYSSLIFTEDEETTSIEFDATADEEGIDSESLDLQ